MEKKPTKWDGTYGTLTRKTWPTLVAIKIPFGSTGRFLLVPGMKYKDGKLSHKLMTEEEWSDLSDDARNRLTVPAEQEYTQDE